MADNALFLYSLLVTFVYGCMSRNQRLGKPHVQQVVIAAWALMLVSISGATYLSLTALDMALQA